MIQAIATVLSYWFPVTGLIIIAAMFIVWIIVAIGGEEKEILGAIVDAR